jgi:hypothetical protein
MKFQHASITEAAIAGHLVQAALDNGWKVSVSDGEEWVVKRSVDYDVITDAMCSTGEDLLRFVNEEGTQVGVVTLIWGNGRDLISDYSTDQNGFDTFMDTMFNFAEAQ